MIFRRPLSEKKPRSQDAPSRFTHPAKVLTSGTWIVRETVGASGVVLRTLPSAVSFELGRVAPRTILHAVSREGDWLQVKSESARRNRSRWDRLNPAEDGLAWVLIQDHSTGTVFLEKSPTQSSMISSHDNHPDDVDLALREMEQAAMSDDYATILDEIERHRSSTNPSIRMARDDLMRVYDARRAEVERERRLNKVLSSGGGELR